MNDTQALLTLAVNFFTLRSPARLLHFTGILLVPDHSGVSHGGGVEPLWVLWREGLRGMAMELTSSGFGRVAILVAEEERRTRRP